MHSLRFAAFTSRKPWLIPLDSAEFPKFRDDPFFLPGSQAVIRIGPRFRANILNSFETQRTQRPQSRPDCRIYLLQSSLFSSAPSAVHKLFILPLNTDASATHRYLAPQLQKK